MSSWQEDKPLTLEDTLDWGKEETLKWGYDGKTNKVHVWRVFGKSKKPSHKGSLKERFTRKPEAKHGDIYGELDYTPAKYSLQGKLMSHAKVEIRTYYDKDCPDEVHTWVDEHFPNADEPSKTSAWSPNQPQKNTWKWAYHPDNGALVWPTAGVSELPYHHYAIQDSWGRDQQPDDITGIASQKGDDSIHIKPYKFDTSNEALSAVKTEFARMYPNLNIDHDPTQADHEALGVEFVPGVSKAGHFPVYANSRVPQGEAWLISSGQWAVMTLGSNIVPTEALEAAGLPPNAPVIRMHPDLFGSSIKRKLTKWWPFKKKAGADLDGSMIALHLPDEIAKKIQIEGGEPLDHMHITLVYFKDKAKDRDDWETISRVVADWAEKTPKLKGKIGGYGIFKNPDGDILYASPSIPGLDELRVQLVKECENIGFEVNDEHGFIPHITLMYDFDGAIPDLEDKLDIEFDMLYLTQGIDKEGFEFGGKK